MKVVTLSVADAYLVIDAVSDEAREKIEAALDRNEGRLMKISLPDDDADRIEEARNPHTFFEAFRTMAIAGAIGISSFIGIAGQAVAHDNQCSRWATMIGKEGRVRDSLVMHYLGCDDGPMANAHYEPNLYGEGCTQLARAIVRSAPDYYVRRPRTVAALVQQAEPWCTVYEDGSYEDNSTH